MKAIESAVGTCLGVTDTGRDRPSRLPKKVVCKSTRNPKSSQGEFPAFQAQGARGEQGSELKARDSGVVPSTAAQPENRKPGVENQRLPPHPHSTTNAGAHARAKASGSRSQSNLHRGHYSSNPRQDSQASRERPSSPLSQFANKPFQPACKILLP